MRITWVEQLTGDLVEQDFIVCHILHDDPHQRHEQFVFFGVFPGIEPDRFAGAEGGLRRLMLVAKFNRRGFG